MGILYCVYVDPRYKTTYTINQNSRYSLLHEQIFSTIAKIESTFSKLFYNNGFYNKILYDTINQYLVKHLIYYPELKYS